MKTQLSQKKIFNRVDLQTVVNSWKRSGEKIVFTNGCFDIVHLGHIDYLEKTSHLADRMIIGVNTDNSVSRIKGPERPIINEVSRTRLLASLGFIDAVVLFDDETPLKLINEVMPDVLVKGKDYDVSNIVGADIVIGNGGKVETIELINGYSTTNIINKIKNEK